MRACFNRSTWSPAKNMQQPPLGTSHLILGDSLMRVLLNLRTSWIITVIGFGCATAAQLFWMVELMNAGRIVDILILKGTNKMSNSSDAEEAQWESMLVCLLTTLWQKIRCALLTICTIPKYNRPQEADTMKVSLDETTSCEIWQSQGWTNDPHGFDGT